MRTLNFLEDWMYVFLFIICIFLIEMPFRFLVYCQQTDSQVIEQNIINWNHFFSCHLTNAQCGWQSTWLYVIYQHRQANTGYCIAT